MSADAVDITAPDVDGAGAAGGLRDANPDDTTTSTPMAPVRS